MFWVVWAIVGLVTWWGMSYVVNDKAVLGGWWASLIATLVGAWLGDWLLGQWLWVLAGFNVIAGIIGGAIFTWLWSLTKTGE